MPAEVQRHRHLPMRRVGVVLPDDRGRADRAAVAHWDYYQALLRLLMWVVRHAMEAVHRRWVAEQNWAARVVHRNAPVQHCSGTCWRRVAVLVVHRVHARVAIAMVARACE